VRASPDAGRLIGRVARATLYFLLRYPGHIEPGELPAERLTQLLEWHDQFPPNDYERHRNAAIHDRQGNRNPLIDHPEWAVITDFSRGLISP